MTGATGYEVKFYTPTPDGWVDLPTDDIGIVFDGSSATVGGLPDDEFYYFRVRAAEWSEWPPGFPDPGEPLPLNHSRRTYDFPDDFPERLKRFQEESGLW